MATQTIEIDFHDITAQAEQLGAGPEIIAEELNRAMIESLDTIEQAVALETPVNLGILRGSISHEIFGEPPDFYGEVGTPVLYGAPVEFGRRPGKMPPVRAIRAWVVRKKLVPAMDSDEDYQEAVDRAAYMIARAIGRRGTKGAHMFERGFRATEPMIPYLWALALDRISERLTE